MRSLARAGRYEEAADVRDRAAALARAIRAQRRTDALRAAGRLEVEVVGESRVIVDGGVLRSAWPGTIEHGPATLPLDTQAANELATGAVLSRSLADEVSTIASWLESKATRVRVVRCEGGLAWPLPRLPTFEPVG
jgi:hypothetical protein